MIWKLCWLLQELGYSVVYTIFYLIGGIVSAVDASKNSAIAAATVCISVLWFWNLFTLINQQLVDPEIKTHRHLRWALNIYSLYRECCEWEAEDQFLPLHFIWDHKLKITQLLPFLKVKYLFYFLNVLLVRRVADGKRT